MTTDITIIKENETFAKIDCNEEINHEINNLFSAFAPGYRFNPRYKHHLWDGRTRFYSPITQLLPIGFVTNLVNWSKKKGYTYKFDGFNNFVDNEVDPEDIRTFINSKLKNGYQIRDYQLNAVYNALNKKRGILLSCTGSGKSLMIYSIFRYLLERKKLKHMILIVPNVSLVEQMYSDFKDYGWDDIENYVELMYAAKKPTHKLPILISTWQSLEKLDKEFFDKYQAMVIDEAHQSKANVVSRIAKASYNSQYKIGTTGTLPQELSDQMAINGVIGDVIFELKSKELIDAGVLTKMNIAGIFLKYPEAFIKENKDRIYQEEIKMVEEYSTRNKCLNFIIDHSKPTDNILILVNHRDHLKQTTKYLNDNYPDRKVSVIHGDVKATVREKIRTGIEHEEGTLLLATYATMSTGVNIPKLHSIVLFSNSKSRIKVLQSIGRGLRKHNTKNKVIIFDIIDDLSYKTRNGKIKKNYCMQHYDERLTFYKEQEFPVITHSLNI